MKLIIQIPCYNEAETLPVTLSQLPRALPGIDAIEWLVVDDGSQDHTAEVASQFGVQHIHRFSHRVGLARAFVTGLDLALRAEADVIVNTDADNQYDARDIPHLIRPILEHRADLVVGDRGVANLANFSSAKRLIHRLGSWIVQLASGARVPDATSGFRAFSREAALRMTVLSEFSYTVETLIQAGQRNLKVAYVPVRTGPKLRDSRLVRSIPHYLAQSIVIIIRAYTMYHPIRIFLVFGLVFILIGLAPTVRFLYFYLIGDGTGHIQSLIFAAVSMIVGFQVLLIGLLADLIGFNRKILEEVLYRLRRSEATEQPKPLNSDSLSTNPGRQ